MVSVTTPPPSRGMTKDILRLLGDIIRAKPWPFTGLMLILIVGNTRGGLYVAAVGGLTQAFIDRDRQDAILWALVFLGSGLMEQLYWPFRNHMRSILVDHASLRIQRRVLARAADVPLEAFEDGPFFARLQRANDNLGRRIGNVVRHLQDVTQVGIMFISILVPLWLIHPYIVVFLVAGCLPSFITQYRTARVVHVAMTRHATTDRLTDRLGDLLINRNAGAELRLFGNGPMLVKRWRDSRSTMADAVLRAERSKLRGTLLGEAGIMVGIGLTIFFVVQLMLDQRAPLGSWAALILGMDFAIQMVAGLAVVTRGAREESAFLGDLFGFEDLADQYATPSGEQPARTSALPTSTGPMALTTTSVSFAYPGSERMVVDDVSLEITPGEHVAIVGENGAGKSTLVRLLTGLYTPTIGTIEQDGTDTRDPASGQLRPHIGAVFQDFTTWQLPLRDNIGFGNVARLDDDDALHAALAKADLHHLPDTLDNGLDAWLGREFGERDLSGGQWQRIAIARAFFRDARFLILDEPTAALDPLAEQRLFERFRDLASGRTALTISHRLGPARNADRILVMKDGRIVESGSHDELIAREGEYAAMFQAQAGWYK